MRILAVGAGSMGRRRLRDLMVLEGGRSGLVRTPEGSEECFNQVVQGDRARLFYEDTRIKDPRLNPVCRGGSFKTPDSPYLYCAYRHEDPLDGRFDCIGFRVALSQ